MAACVYPSCDVQKCNNLNLNLYKVHDRDPQLDLLPAVHSCCSACLVPRVTVSAKYRMSFTICGSEGANKHDSVMQHVQLSHHNEVQVGLHLLFSWLVTSRVYPAYSAYIAPSQLKILVRHVYLFQQHTWDTYRAGVFQQGNPANPCIHPLDSKHCLCSMCCLSSAAESCRPQYRLAHEITISRFLKPRHSNATPASCWCVCPNSSAMVNQPHPEDNPHSSQQTPTDHSSIMWLLTRATSTYIAAITGCVHGNQMLTSSIDNRADTPTPTGSPLTCTHACSAR
jgi:hypothetical protein